MNPTYLLDTGWIVRHLRGSKAYTETLQKIGSSQIAISILSLAELYEGVFRARAPQRAEQAVLTFIADKQLLPITEPIARWFGQERARLRQQNLLIGDIDLRIAATCVHHNLVLLTTNPRHFERIAGLQIISEPW
ncbi:hypothetical protein GBSOP10_10557 [Armatimonadetes bacterium GBS]|nr:hypothetical protein GBSOP10_10557 [Armatimonadetes bacterium GBS]